MLPKKAKPKGPRQPSLFPETEEEIQPTIPEATDTEPKQLSLFSDEPVTQEPPSPSRRAGERLKAVTERQELNVTKRPNTTWNMFKRDNQFHLPRIDSQSIQGDIIANATKRAHALLNVEATRFTLKPKNSRWPQDLASELKALSLDPSNTDMLDVLCKKEDACVILAKGPDLNDPGDQILRGIFVYIYEKGEWLAYYRTFDDNSFRPVDTQIRVFSKTPPVFEFLEDTKT